MNPNSTVAAEAERLKEAICRATVQAVVSRFAGDLRAIVLTGSLARDEASFLAEPGRRVLLGDAEFLLVFHDDGRMPGEADVATILQAIETSLAADCLRAKVGLGFGRGAYLRKIGRNIFAYELRTRGQVIWGEAEILTLIPEFAASEIDPEDAWQLLENRIVEQLDSVPELVQAKEELPDSVHYRTVKLYLDMATSLLVFARAYAPSYAERADILAAFCETARGAGYWPFDLRRFSDLVGRCTRYKLAPAASRDRSWSFWTEAQDYARLLCRWEMERLTGLGPGVSDAQLWSRWAARQGWRRLRGWLYVLRKEGWRPGWQEWLRCGRLAFLGSPRRLVYRAANELFFRLPELLWLKAANTADWARWRKMLPWDPPGPVAEDPGWRRLASAITWNYHHFLEGTRA